ncbi:hypothetical protein ABBQ38_012119 [Trebouxia sp. C0009 RCD-2024]
MQGRDVTMMDEPLDARSSSHIPANQSNIFQGWKQGPSDILQGPSNKKRKGAASTHTQKGAIDRLPSGIRTASQARLDNEEEEEDQPCQTHKPCIADWAMPRRTFTGGDGLPGSVTSLEGQGLHPDLGVI